MSSPPARSQLARSEAGWRPLPSATYTSHGMTKHEQHAASIAVAPFRKPPGDADHARLANGFLEDVIAELARFPSLEVLAARTSLSLTSAQLEPRQLAANFGTTHLVDSTVLPSVDALQISANLIEVPSGRQLWSQKYKVAFRDLLRVPEDIAANVANQLSARIDMARLARAKARPVASLEAYDCWLRGRDCLRRGTIEADAEAREFFERALSIDPSYARAYAGLSLTHFNEWSCQLWSDWQTNERLAFEYACRATDLDQGDHVVQAVLGRVHMHRRNFGQARAHLERALALSPNDADTLVQVGMWTGYLGRGDDAVAMIEKALRLNPLHDASYYVYGATAYFFARELRAAVELAARAPPNLVVDQSAFMAACYAHLGQQAPAAVQLAQFLAAFQDKITFGRPPGRDEPLSFLLHVNPFAKSEDAEFLVEGLRKAGLDPAACASSGPYLPEKDARPARFSPDGDHWLVSYDQRTVRIKDMKGCRDIALLLGSARERIHCMEIAGRMAEGHAGEALSARARAECQRRLRELRTDIEEAERDHDLGRQQALSGELSRLTAQLTAALGLGGRSRRLGDPAEKARTAVTWRIRTAIKKIGQAHPELGRHLEASIRTGAFCTYAPERAVEWAV
jgi:TolB-like protein/Tfp pilus assembly protein PilF